MSQGFIIDIEISVALTVDEIWPNGDAPASPTMNDVQEAIKGYGNLKEVADDWELWSGDVSLTVTEAL